MFHQFFFMKTFDPARHLYSFLGISDLHVWTSQLVRTKQTAAFVNAPKSNFSQFNEIDAGKFDSYTYDEVLETYPDEFKARAWDKLCYRYPNGTYFWSFLHLVFNRQQP